MGENSILRGTIYFTICLTAYFTVEQSCIMKRGEKIRNPQIHSLAFPVKDSSENSDNALFKILEGACNDLFSRDSCITRVFPRTATKFCYQIMLNVSQVTCYIWFFLFWSCSFLFSYHLASWRITSYTSLKVRWIPQPRKCGNLFIVLLASKETAILLDELLLHFFRNFLFWLGEYLNKSAFNVLKTYLTLNIVLISIVFQNSVGLIVYLSLF